MATNKSELASLVDEHIRKSIGMSTGRLQAVATADLDALALQLKAGPPLIRYRVGGYYGANGPVSTLLLTEDQMVLGPILVQQYCVAEEIGIDVTTAASEGNLYTALYRDSGSGYPDTLVHASAALGITTGFKSTTGLEIELTPGIYWGGAVCNQVTTTVATVRSIATSSPYVGETNGANDINNAAYASTTTVTGAPPATFSYAALVVAQAPKLLFKVKSS